MINFGHIYLTCKSVIIELISEAYTYNEVGGKSIRRSIILKKYISRVDCTPHGFTYQKNVAYFSDHYNASPLI
jgi:hypothetical protein